MRNDEQAVPEADRRRTNTAAFVARYRALPRGRFLAAAPAPRPSSLRRHISPLSTLFYVNWRQRRRQFVGIKHYAAEGYKYIMVLAGWAITLLLRCYALFNNVRRARVAAGTGARNRRPWGGIAIMAGR